MKKAILIILSVLMLLSCNLDSGQGVFQQAFNATKKNYEMIQAVLGVAEDKVIFQANKDLYSFDGVDTEKIAEISSQKYFAIFAHDDKIYFADQLTDKGKTSFFYATIEELNPSSGISESVINSNTVNVTIDDTSATGNIIHISTKIQDLDTIQVCYYLDTDSVGNPNNKIKHYGLIDRDSITENSFTISGTAEVPATATVFGIGALRVYQDDSEQADGSEYLKNLESVIYRTSDSSKFNIIEIADGNKVDVDKIPMGFDGDGMVDLQGYYYHIKDGKRTRIEGFNASDLIYRNNNIMMVYYDNNLKLGYLYEEGIYVNDADKKDTNGNPAPYIIPITDDNDLQTACWIGKSGNKYLFATQENGFWIAKLNEKKNDNGKYTGSIHQYNSGADFDGPLSDYLPQSN